VSNASTLDSCNSTLKMRLTTIWPAASAVREASRVRVLHTDKFALNFLLLESG